MTGLQQDNVDDYIGLERYADIDNVSVEYFVGKQHFLVPTVSALNCIRLSLNEDVSESRF